MHSFKLSKTNEITYIYSFTHSCIYCVYRSINRTYTVRTSISFINLYLPYILYVLVIYDLWFMVTICLERFSFSRPCSCMFPAKTCKHVTGLHQPHKEFCTAKTHIKNLVDAVQCSDHLSVCRIDIDCRVVDLLSIITAVDNNPTNGPDRSTKKILKE